MIYHEVITTERVPFRYRVAGLGSRFLAWQIDFLLIVLLILMGMIAGLVLEIGRAGLGVMLALLWSFAVQWGYFVLFEWLWHGQSPGKRLVGIRVIQWRGTGITFARSAVRNILRVADGLPLLVPDLVPCLYGLGFVVAACNREGRRLGDLAAGTLVVHVERRPRPIRALALGAMEAERSRRATLRQRLGQLDREQKQTLVDLCLRRDQLGVQERARLFRMTAAYLQERFELAPADYQSDEKFILELSAALTERTPEETSTPRARALPR